MSLALTVGRTHARYTIDYQTGMVWGRGRGRMLQMLIAASCSWSVLTLSINPNPNVMALPESFLIVTISA